MKTLKIQTDNQMSTWLSQKSPGFNPNWGNSFWLNIFYFSLLEPTLATLYNLSKTLNCHFLCSEHKSLLFVVKGSFKLCQITEIFTSFSAGHFCVLVFLHRFELALLLTNIYLTMRWFDRFSTHIVGKWHLGYFKPEYQPNVQGFRHILW